MMFIFLFIFILWLFPLKKATLGLILIWFKLNIDLPAPIFEYNKYFLIIVMNDQGIEEAISLKGYLLSSTIISKVRKIL